MSKFEKFYKIVAPMPDQRAIQDSQDISGGALFSSHSWYQRLVQGSSTRMTRYREYDLMDDDVDIARALDTIAEEMTQMDRKTGMPFKLKFKEIETDASRSQANIIVEALRYWVDIHEFDNKLFHIARTLVKYGDCFFDKSRGNTKAWIHVPPKLVTAAIVDEDDVTRINGWMIRDDTKKALTNTGGYSLSGQEYTTTLKSSDEFVHMSLCDDMSDIAPFGESILKSVYRSYKQKDLLEDSIVIYRIVRAPERRVFYIDVGKMPPHRTKTYLEQIKNEIRQKKIPTQGRDGSSAIESVYNPHSTNEDFFFAQRCLSLDTSISLLDGRELTLREIIDEYSQGKINYTYSVDQTSGEFIPGEIEWAGVTRRDAKVLEVTLDGGQVIVCTPDHKFVLRDGSEVEAQNLYSGCSLMSLYRNRHHNHKVVSVKMLTTKMDTGCLTIKDPGNNHNFALTAGVYVKNSDGKGSKVETLPGGQGLGELADLEYFQSRVYRGLRVPTSYMSLGGSDQNAIFNDGRVGQAYIEELRFANYCMRLQKNIAKAMDKEFKQFLRDIGITFDATVWDLDLCEPTNFGLYKQQESDSQLLTTLSNASSLESFFSKRYCLTRFAQMDEEEMLRNERLLAQEKGVGADDPEYYKKIYGPPPEEGGAGGGLGDLGGGGGMGGGLGGPDISGDMEAGDETMGGGDLEGMEGMEGMEGGEDLGGEMPAEGGETPPPPEENK